MTIQLIGAGLGRTGAHSLKFALERLLGGTCHHMVEVFGHPEEIPVWAAAMRNDGPNESIDWPGFLADYRAIVDYPGAAVWRELAAAFPDAPILLSTRSSAQTWWDSASATILQTGDWEEPDEAGRVHKQMIENMFGRSLGTDLTDADAMMAAYDAHNAAVRAEVPAARLFEYQPGDDWAPLCAALDLPIPDEPFPHTNTREEFRSRAGMDT